MPLIAKSFLATLPADDEYRKIHREPELFAKMIATTESADGQLFAAFGGGDDARAA